MFRWRLGGLPGFGCVGIDARPARRTGIGRGLAAALVFAIAMASGAAAQGQNADQEEEAVPAARLCVVLTVDEAPAEDGLRIRLEPPGKAAVQVRTRGGTAVFEAVPFGTYRMVAIVPSVGTYRFRAEIAQPSVVRIACSTEEEGCAHRVVAQAC